MYIFLSLHDKVAYLTFWCDIVAKETLIFCAPAAQQYKLGCSAPQLRITKPCKSWPRLTKTRTSACRCGQRSSRLGRRRTWSRSKLPQRPRQQLHQRRWWFGAAGGRAGTHRRRASGTDLVLREKTTARARVALRAPNRNDDTVHKRQFNK